MIFYRSIILLAAMQFYTVCAWAQQNNYVYKDTAIFYADSVNAKQTETAQDANEDGESEVEYIPDTVLQSNRIFIEPDSVMAIKNAKSFEYSKNLDSLLYQYQQSQKAQKAPEMSWLERILLSPFTQYFFWMLGAAFVSFILYKLFFTEGFFQRASAKSNVTLLPGEMGNLLNNADYANLIAQAVGNGNYRMAVRYHYLQSLQKLSAKGAIDFAPDKTNYQYVNELQGKGYKNAFAALTLHYEYVWYGEFIIDENIFNAIQNKFIQFNNEV